MAQCIQECDGAFCAPSEQANAEYAYLSDWGLTPPPICAPAATAAQATHPVPCVAKKRHERRERREPRERRERHQAQPLEPISESTDVQFDDSMTDREAKIFAIDNALDICKQFWWNHEDKLKDLRTTTINTANGFQIAGALFNKLAIYFTEAVFEDNEFSQHIAENIMSIPAGTNFVNLFGIVYGFLRVCNDFKGAEFAPATYRSTVFHPKKHQFDADYDIPHHIGEKTLAESSFITLFKAFRSIVNRSMRRITKSYKTPDFTQSGSWKYAIYTESGQKVEKTSEEFIEFMRAYTPIFTELEHLSKPLTEVFTVFNDAKKKIQRH
jgi:hypothetical protein